VIACFALRDQLRDDAAGIVAQLRTDGLRVHLLSGDRLPAVELAARQLGLADFRGDARPHDKLAYIKALQQQGRRVLMVGDGINDGPVLAAADVSIAVSEATNLARVAADLVSVRPGLAQVARALQMGRRTRAVIFQNLAWASVYNLLAIPAAALGWVPPWVAAIGMSVSSLIVALNASRLWSWNRSTC
jgi:P-type Cu2+ transporter